MIKPKKKIRFIVNPISGTEKKKAIVECAKQKLAGFFDIDIYYTKGPGDAGRAAHEARDNGFDAVVAVGGDGTVNEIGSQLINSKTRLGIIPAGSGNGLARHLHIPLNYERAIEVVKNFPKSTLDTILLNGLPFFNVSGIGFDAYVGYIFATLKTRGFKTYVKATYRAFFNFKPFIVHVSSQGENLFSGRAYMVSIANSSQFGNNCYINPEARTNDGRFEVAVLQPFPRWKAPLLLYRLFMRNIHHSRYIKVWSLTQAEISTKRMLKMHLDGEVLEDGNHIDVRVIPASVNVIAPDFRQ